MILSRKIDGVQQTYVDIIIGSAEYWEPDIHGEYRPVSHFFTDERLGKWVVDLVEGMEGQLHHPIYLVVQIA